MKQQSVIHTMVLFLALSLGVQAGAREADKSPAAGDRLACAFPFELQVVRGLDFGRIALERGHSGQVDVEADGAYRQLGGAFVSLPPTPAELQFCGPADARFELQIREDAGFGASLGPRAPQLAAGSLGVIAMGAELRRVSLTTWEGTIGSGGNVSIRIAGRLDLSSQTVALPSSAHVSVSLRSR